MTVWIITDTGNEVVGVFDSYNTAMSSINFSYHKLHVKVDVRPTWKNQEYRNDWQVTIEISDDVAEGSKREEHLRLYEAAVHSSMTHL